MAGFKEKAAADRVVYPQSDSGNSQRLDMAPNEEFIKRMEWSLFIPMNNLASVCRSSVNREQECETMVLLSMST